jgi:hypothetical protein
MLIWIALAVVVVAALATLAALIVLGAGGLDYPPRR